MKMDHTLTVERLRGLIEYDPMTGKFSRGGELVREFLAGRYGRLQVYVDRRLHYAARVAFAHFHGHWPKGQIDHINGDHTDNRIENLRDVTNAQNAQNRSRPRHCNSTGFLGVSFHKQSGRYRARIMVDGVMRSLGFHATAEQAHEAYLTAKREVHPHWVEPTVRE